MAAKFPLPQEYEVSGPHRGPQHRAIEKEEELPLHLVVNISRDSVHLGEKKVC